MSDTQSECAVNYPAWKPEFVQRCLDTDGVVTEIDEQRYGYKYHAGLAEDDGWVWLATIRTDNGDGVERDERTAKVTFRKCLPASDLHVLYSWSTVAVKGCLGPAKLDSWRSIHRVFHAADELLQTHDPASSSGEQDGGA